MRLVTVLINKNKPYLDTTVAQVPDSIYSRYNNFFSNYHYPAFLNKVWRDTAKDYDQGFDGIIISGTFTDNLGRHNFSFWSPYHDAKNMSLFLMSLEDMDSFLRKKENKKYLKTMRRYAD